MIFLKYCITGVIDLESSYKSKTEFHLESSLVLLILAHFHKSLLLPPAHGRGIERSVQHTF